METVSQPFAELDVPDIRALRADGVCRVDPGLDPGRPLVFAKEIHEWMAMLWQERPAPPAQVAGAWWDLVPLDKGRCGGQVNKS